MGQLRTVQIKLLVQVCIAPSWHIGPRKGDRMWCLLLLQSCTLLGPIHPHPPSMLHPFSLLPRPSPTPALLGRNLPAPAHTARSAGMQGQAIVLYGTFVTASTGEIHAVPVHTPVRNGPWMYFGEVSLDQTQHFHQCNGLVELSQPHLLHFLFFLQIIVPKFFLDTPISL